MVETAPDETDRAPTDQEAEAESEADEGRSSHAWRRRLVILVRPVLMLPPVVLAALTTAGMIVAGPFTWLAALALGRVPGPLRRANGAVINHLGETLAYATLQAGEYPSPGALFTAKAPPSADPDAPAAPDLDAPAPPAPAGTRWAPTTLVAVFLVLGLAAAAAWPVLQATVYAGPDLGAASATRLGRDYASLSIAGSQFYTTVTSRCTNVGDRPACLQRGFVTFSTDLARFARQVDALWAPPELGRERAALAVTARRTALGFTHAGVVVRASPANIRTLVPALDRDLSQIDRRSHAMQAALAGY